MKKLIYLLGLLCLNTFNAQLAVTDVGANAQLQELSISLERANAQLQAMGGISSSNEGNTLASKILNEKNLKFIGEVEDTYWKVDSYLRKGQEMKNILSMEEKILGQISELRKEVSQSGLNRSSVQEFYTLTRNLLKTTGSLVDVSIDIVSDDKFRMTYDERRRQLQEVLSGLNWTSNLLNDKILSIRNYRMMNERFQKQKQAMEEQKRRMESIKNKK